MKCHKKAFTGIIILLIIVPAFFFFNNSSNNIDITDYPSDKIAELEQQIKKDSENTELLFELALEYNKYNDTDRIEALYRKLIALKPSENLYKLNLANLYFEQGKFKESSNEYWSALTYNKKQMMAYTALLSIYEFTDAKDSVKINEVIENLLFIELDEKSFANGNEVMAAISSLAHAYKLTGQYEEAIIYYGKKIEHKIGKSAANQAEIDEIKAILESN